MKVLETNNFILSVPTQKDYKNLLALRQDPEVMKYVGEGALGKKNFGQGKIQTKEQVQEHIDLAKDYYDDYGFAFFCGYDKKTSDFIGQAGLFHLRFNINQPEIELAYRLHKKYWGKGYATECAIALIEWGVNERGLSRIIAPVHPDNHRSRRVMEKAGMVYEGEMDYKGHQLPYYATP